MSYNPLAIANGFLELGYRDDVYIDPMKIQKLCYFAHGYYLAANNGEEGLVNRSFEAWPFGPVCPPIYETFKKYGREGITDYGRVYSSTLQGFVPAAAPETDKRYTLVRDRVWELYGKRPSISLSDLTHRAGGAWDRTWSNARGSRNAPIDDKEIFEEFAPLVKRNQ